ncbi:hypothetical protein POPTR_001G055600v4 [Populus trichocarpa]|uniref:Response regulatory domain-containing protein n=1 Tax=Populus trichocarpa TaxID=3694 RepID=B9GMK0_POPTR|nr:two-component response regulator ARR22 [Populus trichocarpa]PNT52859.1 hypothetical protein POPTR_001G055600v4 [Populus trichocarpa]|eukprot:XP_002299304.1 two-component response regulator ARR22 [Populus trichocarpa]
MADEDHNKKYVESETVILEIMKSWLRHCIDEDSERRGRELEKRIGQMKKGEEETEKILSELEMYAEQPFAGQRNIKEVVDMINYLVLWLKKKIIDCDKFLKEIRMRKRSGVEEGSDSSTMMKNFSVLVVEDDSYLRNLYRRLLNVFGFLNDFQMKVEMAANGKEAVDVLRGGVSLNLIIMDMDRCTNALEEIRELRALGVESNIIGYTSSTAEAPDQQKTFMEAGLNGWFQKPMTFEIITPFLSDLTNNN